MSLSNYPPGVTGNEPQIAGIECDYERETRLYCEHCHRITDGLERGLGDDRWFDCDECEDVTTLPTWTEVRESEAENRWSDLR